MATMKELELESTMGGQGREQARDIPVIDLSDFENRREEITHALWQAATEVGFFQLANHGIPIAELHQAFDLSQAFFALPESEKRKFALQKGQNVGWEFKSQVRPSTHTPDQKESFQVTLSRMQGYWPDQLVLPEFQRVMLDFEYKAWALGMQVLSCFATRIGFDKEFFTRAHDRSSPEYQSTLRLIHYLPVDEEIAKDPTLWRAGAHTDFDCLTMVFQREGQGGLQVCPGNDADANGEGPAWTSVAAHDDLITCNIGDMLMRWSDDKLKSTLHRVRMPAPEDATKPRFSTVFFCQANRDQIVQGPEHKYEPITAADYLQQRIEANYGKKQG